MDRTATAPGRPRRRDQQRDDTRRDLAFAAFRLATSQGLGNVRVPDIAAAAGVSPRTFNNYFTSKEEAIVWPAAQHAAGVADLLRARPAREPLADAIVAAVTGLYRPTPDLPFPAQWLRDFRTLVAAEPALHAEYLRAAGAAEGALAEVIAERTGGENGDLWARVLAGMVTGAERAAVMHWLRHREGRLVDAVRAAVRQATAGIDEFGRLPGGRQRLDRRSARPDEFGRLPGGRQPRSLSERRQVGARQRLDRRSPRLDGAT